MSTPKLFARPLLAAALCAVTGVAAAAIPLQRWTQPNGAEVYLVESPGIPMVDVQIDFDAGSRRDPAAQAGLASMTAGQANKGIAATPCGSLPGLAAVTGAFGKASAPARPESPCEPAMDENVLGEAWADLGASFAAAAGRDRMSFALRTLTYPDLLPKAVALAARQLGAPAFDAQVWQRDRERIGAALRDAYTRPGPVANRTYQELVYGKHPYGQETTEATLAAIDVDDMRAFYARGMLPCRAKVSVVGAVTRDGADALVRQLLARLPQTACAPLPDVAEVPALAEAVERRVPFQANQAQVLIGQPGIRRDDPDFFAVLVGNHILGAGGFTSRLTHEVREKRGLTYGVSSDFSPGRHAGAFTIGLQTRANQADAAIAVTRETLARFVADGPTEPELRAAKDNLVGGFALRLDSNRKLLGNVANIAWNGLPLDYLDHWTARVEAVTQAQIRAAFARMLQPERMVTVVVGAKP
jgi:zinc protease